jgi:hypothetical protein
LEKPALPPAMKIMRFLAMAKGISPIILRHTTARLFSIYEALDEKNRIYRKVL